MGRRVLTIEPMASSNGSSPTDSDLPQIVLTDNSGSYFALKRAADVLVAGALLVVLAPLLLVIAVAIKLETSGPGRSSPRNGSAHCDAGGPVLTGAASGSCEPFASTSSAR